MPKGGREIGGEKARLEKPLFEMCWFYVGIAQIALDPPSPLSNGQTWKKYVPQTILASPYTPGQSGKKVPRTILASLYTPPLTPLRAMPIWKQHISKRGFPKKVALHEENLDRCAYYLVLYWIG